MPRIVCLRFEPPSSDVGQAIKDRLLRAGYTVRDSQRYWVLLDMIQAERDLRLAADLADADLILSLRPDDSADLISVPAHTLRRFRTVEMAAAYLEARAADDDPQMVPELF